MPLPKLPVPKFSFPKLPLPKLPSFLRGSETGSTLQRLLAIKPRDHGELVVSETEQQRPNDAPSTDWRSPLLIGWSIIIFGLGGGLAWAALAPLDSAVSAAGVVSVESNRKTVQHLEGGIVREILVRDGDYVETGEPLFRLDGTAAMANLEVVRNIMAATLAEEARLIAERDSKTELVFPQIVIERQSEAIVAQAIADQNQLFQERKNYLSAQMDVLQAQIRQAQERVAGAAQEHASGLKQISWVDQELPALRELYKKGLVQWTRITSLERQRAQLEGITASAAATHATLLQTISETNLKISELRRQFQQQVAEAIATTRKTIAEAEQRQKIAQDILDRLVITAPQAGVVQGLKIFTTGAVIRAGDPLLDIVPLNDELVIRAQISPLNMDVVHAGLKAEIRFPSFKMPYIPYMQGYIRTISYDRLTDETTGDAYFAANIVADRSSLPEEVRDKLRAGLPAEVMVISGERTPLEYLMRPLSDRMRKGMRE